MLLQELHLPNPLENEQNWLTEQVVESVHAFEDVICAVVDGEGVVDCAKWFIVHNDMKIKISTDKNLIYGFSISAHIHK